MNFKYIECVVVMVCNVLHGKLVRLYYDCFKLCSIYVYPFLQFYLLYCHMQLMRARNEIKVNRSKCVLYNIIGCNFDIM